MVIAGEIITKGFRQPELFRQLRSCIIHIVQNVHNGACIVYEGVD